MYHCIFSERYDANRFARRSSPFRYCQQLAVTHRKCAAYADGKPSAFEGRIHTHYIVTATPVSGTKEVAAKHYRERISAAIIRQASQRRATICDFCKQSACRRSNTTQCKGYGFRIRVKAINSLSHLINCIAYLQRADPAAELETSISQAACQSSDQAGPLVIVNISDAEESDDVQEGPSGPQSGVSNLDSVLKNIEWGALRVPFEKKRKAADFRIHDTTTHGGEPKKVNLSPSIPDVEHRDAATQTESADTQQSITSFIQSRLQSFAREISGLQQLVGALSKNNVEEMDHQ